VDVELQEVVGEGDLEAVGMVLQAEVVSLVEVVSPVQVALVAGVVVGVALVEVDLQDGADFQAGVVFHAEVIEVVPAVAGEAGLVVDEVLEEVEEEEEAAEEGPLSSLSLTDMLVCLLPKARSISLSQKTSPLARQSMARRGYQ